MDKQKHTPNYNINTIPLVGYRILFFLAQIFILVVCIEFMQVLYNNDILPDKLVKETYIQTDCTILSKKLDEKGRLIKQYRADFQVNYLVNDKVYQAAVTGNGLDQAYFHKRQPQQDILDQFVIGSSYPCWYNPQIPQIMVLVLRHNWSSTLPLAIPTIIGLIALYYILKNIFVFLGLLASTTREMTRSGRHYKK